MFSRAKGRRGKRHRLQARLLFFFVGAIVVAIGASVATTWLTSAPDPGEAPTRVVSRHVQKRLEKTWDEGDSAEKYVMQLRESTGLDFKLQRDFRALPARHRAGASGAMFFEDGVATFPVVKNGSIVGFLELRTADRGPAPIWRVAIALGAALLFLFAAAWRVARRLARPLEQVASAAERFGAGDLTARVGIEAADDRWIAEDVREVGRAFDGMAERIGKVVTEQRELLAAISHELRSPLGRARVALEIARERSDEVAERVLADADKQLVEVDAILGDLLASARAGLADLRLKRFDLAPWIDTKIAAESLGPISVDHLAGGHVKADGALLSRALHNLVANAWAHGHPKDLPLVVRVERRDVMMRVSVRDRGPGFPNELLARVFDPFVQGGNDARSPGQQGLGLGLALVRRIVEAHGGTVTARNLGEHGGGGAEVAFEIPADLP